MELKDLADTSIDLKSRILFMNKVCEQDNNKLDSMWNSFSFVKKDRENLLKESGEIEKQQRSLKSSMIKVKQQWFDLTNTNLDIYKQDETQEKQQEYYQRSSDVTENILNKINQAHEENN